MAWIEGPKCSQGKAHKQKGCSGRHGYNVRWREPHSHKTVSKFYRSFEDARAFKAEVERQIHRNEYSPAAERKILLEDHVEKVISSDWNLRGSSRYAYRVRFEKWIRGSKLGRTPLDRITATQLREFLESVDNGPGARANVHQLLAKALNQAVNDGILSRSPLKSVRAPKKERQKEVEPLPVVVIERLAGHARDEMYRLAIHLAAYAGLRAGEVGGLRLQDVNQFTNHLSVVQATSREGGQAILGQVKTKASRRRIEVGRSLIAEILAFVEANGVMDDGRIFRTPKGGYLEHIRLNQECQAAAKRAGLPPVNFHSLRHTCVSLLIQSGAQPKRIQEFVGHSNIGMTMDTYGHLFASDEGEIAARMEALRDAAMSPRLSKSSPV